MKTAFICNNQDNVNRVYGAGRKERIAQISDLVEGLITEDNFEQRSDELKDVEAIFSTWGMPFLSEEKLDCMPKLRAVLYAAGSVKNFAEPMLKKGIQVVSAWAANAYPVAEFTLSQILLSNKGYFRNLRNYKSKETYKSWGHPAPKGNFGESVAILGAGQVGRLVMDMLKPHTLKVLVYDPYLSEEAAETMGVKKVSLEEAFAQAYTVSNHMPDLPETKHIINGKLLASMREGASFINTGRGATIKEDELIEVFKARPDLTALLDVTMPEPPENDSALYTLPNVLLSSHLAGALGDEVIRMSDCMIEEFIRLKEGQPLRYGISLEKLKIMA
ncbi:MAG: hydroxyacid dehydrogenase [Christensenellales bacterium]|jgi:phosphoglycerate dehydrogenase-like enzyme